MKKVSLISLLMLFVFGTQQMYSQVIDMQKSVANFSISNMKFKTVEGSFKGMKGTIIFDENNLHKSLMNVCIDASTVNTESKMRDKHLQNEDYFYVEKHPHICFTSTKITKTAEGYTVYGALEMHGVKREVAIPFIYNNKSFKGTLSLNRLDYELGPKGTFMVGDVVDLTIVCKLK